MTCSRILQLTEVKETGLQFEGSDLDLFFNSGVIFAFFQPKGRIPESSNCWTITWRIGAMTSAASFKALFAISSGPTALLVFNSLNTLATPSVDTVMSGMSA